MQNPGEAIRDGVGGNVCKGTREEDYLYEVVPMFFFKKKS